MFNKTHVYFVFVFSFFLHGCVTPTGRYKQLAGLGENSAISDPKQAIASMSPTELTLSQEARLKIRELDPIVKFGDFFSYSKLIKFSIPESGNYVFTLESTCRCFGLLKTMLIPRVIILDDKGTVLEEDPKQLFDMPAGWTIPVHLWAEWATTFQNSGDFFLLILGDNSAVGQIVGTAEGTHTWTSQQKVSPVLMKITTTKYSFDIPIFNSPIGDIRIKIQRAGK